MKKDEMSVPRIKDMVFLGDFNSNILLDSLYMDCMSKKYFEALSYPFFEVGIFSVNGRSYFFSKNQYSAFELKLKETLNDFSQTKKMFDVQQKHINLFIKFGKKAEKFNYSKLKKEELHKLLDGFYSKLMPLTLTAQFAIFIENILTERLSKYKISEDLLVLSQPSQLTDIEIEHNALIGLAELIKKDPEVLKLFLSEIKIDADILKNQFKKIQKAIDNHIDKFKWRSSYFFTLHVSNEFNEDFIINNLSDYIKSGAKKINIKERLKLQLKAKKKLKDNGKLLELLLQIAQFKYQKLYRVENFNHIVYNLKPLWQRVCEVLGISRELFVSRTFKDIISAHENENLNMTEVYEGLIFNSGKLSYLKSHDLENYRNDLASVDASVDLKGTSAYYGKVTGRVKIIKGHHDMSKFSKGDILVTTMTDPDFVPIMAIAKAIITDNGGVLCHAALISRELKIPCIVATEIATKVLKDGDMVEVDADNGIVKILKKS